MRARLKRTPRAVLVVFGLGIALRVLLMVLHRPGFVGYADSSGFVANARAQLFGEVFRTAGYPLFLRITHFFNDELAWTVVLQHVLGVGTAGLLYLASRRLGAPVWAALVPAAIVLFGGMQLLLEHSVLSEAPFTFLVALSVWLAASSEGASRAPLWLAGAGASVGLASTVRPAGLLLIPALALWAVLARETWRRRGLAVAAVLVAGIAPMAVYVIAQESKTGFTGVTRSSGWSLYARVAEFAKCSEFEPPAGTRVLCERREPSKRHSANSYLYLVEYSPARKKFGSPPSADAKVGAFARGAILNQPLSYARVVLRDSLRPVFYGRGVRPGSGLVNPRLVEVLPSAARERELTVPIDLYWEQPIFRRAGIGSITGYANTVRIEGVGMGLLYVLSLVGVLLARGRERRGAVLFALCGAALILAPAAALFYDVRYAVPAYGVLAGSAAFGALAVAQRLRRR